MEPVPGVGAEPGTLGTHLRVTYHPILDVARGVAAGYQACADLSAVDGPIDAAGFLTAAVASVALGARAGLPPNCFLAVPIGADAAASPVVGDVLGTHGSLIGVVLDIVGSSSGAPAELDAALTGYRDAGALISVGGYGAPQPELTSIVRLKPSIIRLGRDWVRDVDRSRAKKTAIETVGRLAGLVDAWVLAEDVSSAGELRALAELGVPLAQGRFVGRASAVCAEIDASVRAALPAVLTHSGGRLAELVQPVYTTDDPAVVTSARPETSGLELMVLVDADRRPVSILQRTAGAAWTCVAALTVNVDTAPADAVSRAMLRPWSARFTPLACTDDAGRFIGVLRIETLVERLADSRLPPR